MCNLRLAIVSFFGLMIFVQASVNDRASDRIFNLPGVRKTSKFEQYSGYINGKNDDVFLFYWLVKSKHNKTQDPLVLWLNGGPGCSSLFGLLVENGPYKFNDKGVLVKNPHSWNNIANMLYLESPVGVGFSFSTKGVSERTDTSTALDNYHAVLNFLDKFPEFRYRDLYLTGESYAGIYLPMLAMHLIPETSIKLRGVFVGNPLTDNEINSDTRIHMAYYYGFLDDQFYRETTQACCSDPCEQDCPMATNQSPMCLGKLDELIQYAPPRFNVYNVYSNCAAGVNDTAPDLTKQSTYETRYVSTENDYNCVNDFALKTYLNSRKVQRSIHVDPRWKGPWESCRFEHYVQEYRDVSQMYRTILQAGVRMFVYSGDVDLMCNHIGTKKFVEQLGLKPQNLLEPWQYQDEEGHGQVGGWEKTYMLDNTPITHATVRGSGHMVPMDTPVQAITLFSRFLASDATTCQPFLQIIITVCFDLALYYF